MKELVAALEKFLEQILEDVDDRAGLKILSEARRIVKEKIEKLLRSNKKALTKQNAEIVLKAAMKEAVENYKINEKKRNPLLISIEVDCEDGHIDALLANWPEPDSDAQDSIRNINNPLKPSRGASQNIEDQENDDDEEEALENLARHWEKQARGNGQGRLDDAYMAAEKSKEMWFLYSLTDDKTLKEIATENYNNAQAAQNRLANINHHNKSTRKTKSYSSRQVEYA